MKSNHLSCSSYKKPFLLTLYQSFYQLYLKYYFKGLGTLVGFFYKQIRRFVPLPSGMVLTRTIDGIKMLVAPAVDKGVEEPIFYEGTYEAGSLHVLKKCLREGDSFMDIGANIGLMSITAAIKVGEKGKVYSFEPDKETFLMLYNNIELNGFTNCFPQNFGLGTVAEVKRLYKANHNRGGASLISTGEDEEFTEVVIETLNDFLVKNQISSIRMAKLDVEGWEIEVMKGGLGLFQGNDAPILFMEYTRKFHTDELPKLLWDLGYNIFVLEKGKDKYSKLVAVTPSSTLKYQDNIFCFKAEHLAESGLKKLFR